MTATPGARLQDVLITPQLHARIPRDPDYKAESEAFRQLSASLASGSDAVLDTLVNLAYGLCHAESAGVSLIGAHEADQSTIIRHVSVIGELAALSGSFSPFTPAVDVQGSFTGAQLYDRPGRYFKYLEAAAPVTNEALVVPVRSGDRELGSIWVASHGPERQFDTHDVHLLENLAQIAASVIDHREALAEAKYAVEEREELLSIGSHELRNPLTTVVGFANRLARRQDLPDDAQEEVRLVAREAGRLRRIIDDFFDLAKLESTAFNFDFQEVDLVEVLHEQVAALRMRHPNTTLEEELDDVALVHTDPTRVAQIVANLLENAAKYGGDAPHITARLRSDTAAYIEVTDGGPGIPAVEQDRIFDRAYRLHQRDGATREGLGIGLYISRELARRLRGSLTVDSTPGQGSTFTLTLPLEA